MARVAAALRDQVHRANMELAPERPRDGTFGNVSGIDRAAGLMAIKPSGVPYDTLRPEHIVPSRSPRASWWTRTSGRPPTRPPTSSSTGPSPPAAASSTPTPRARPLSPRRASPSAASAPPTRPLPRGRAGDAGSQEGRGRTRLREEHRPRHRRDLPEGPPFSRGHRRRPGAEPRALHVGQGRRRRGRERTRPRVPRPDGDPRARDGLLGREAARPASSSTGTTSGSTDGAPPTARRRGDARRPTARPPRRPPSRGGPPDARPREALVRVEAIGLCGSDLHWFEEGGIGSSRITHPIVPGHEMAGRTEDGRLVAIEPPSPARPARSAGKAPEPLPEDPLLRPGDDDGSMREWMAGRSGTSSAARRLHRRGRGDAPSRSASRSTPWTSPTCGLA